MEITYRNAVEEDLQNIIDLLKENQLPFDDLSDNQVKFLIAETGHKIIGCIGIEMYGNDALLRSFAVDDQYKNQNIGSSLFNQLLDFAAKEKIKKIHLLTTTAKDYFLKKGFEIAERNEAPNSIQKTSEFSEICPSSSTYMQFSFPKNILVLCTGNSCRSQIAEGYLRFFAKNRAKIYSAGIETHGVNPKAIATMKEDGIDISLHTSNPIDEYQNIDFDFVITVCDNAKENCPYFPTKAKKFHYNFPDPAKARGSEEEIMEEFRKVRNQIKSYCKNFVEENL